LYYFTGSRNNIGSRLSKLFAAILGADCDWIVKLIDVFPSGHDLEMEKTKYDIDNFQMLVADEAIRTKYRNDLKKPVAVEPDRI
jgi:hypothetical protein